MTLFQRFIKRLFDLVFSLSALLIFSPVMAAVAAAIKLDSKGSVFFLQERVGKDKKLFKCIKFRTMVVGAEKIGKGYEIEKEDPRITRLGKFLRRWALDELPQLINILKGGMSVVGPRPTLLYQVEQYSPLELRRLEVKPGLTGWAQVHGRNQLTWPQRIEKDIWYIDHYSFWLDMKILWMTLKVLSTDAGVYGE